MKINTGFSKLTSVNFAAQVDLVITSLTGNASFPEPWPATVPTLAQLQADLTSFQSNLNAIAKGDRGQIVNREATRQKLTAELASVAAYVQCVANGDATMLATTGYPARKVPQRSQLPETMAAPAQLVIERGGVSGQLIVRASRVSKAVSYDVQITTSDPTVEASWASAGTYTTCRRIQLDGLTPGKVYTVRMRAFGPTGSGDWTISSSLMVV